MAKPKLQRVKLLLQARPSNPPKWWPETDDGWVTVRSDGQGWTLGKDRAHVAPPRMRRELAEGFRMTMRYAEKGDWKWGRWHFREVEP